MLPQDQARLCEQIAAKCRLYHASSAGGSSSTGAASPAAAPAVVVVATSRAQAGGVTVRYAVDLRRGLPEDAEIRAAGLGLLTDVLVHDPAGRLSWEQFFSSPFVDPQVKYLV